MYRMPVMYTAPQSARISIEVSFADGTVDAYLTKDLASAKKLYQELPAAKKDKAIEVAFINQAGRVLEIF